MTLVVEDIETTETIQVLPEKVLAPWRLRAGALAIDVLPGLAVVATMFLVSLTVPTGVWLWVSVGTWALTILLILVNRLLLPSITGWSLGRALTGIAVTESDGTRPGPWWLLLRDLAHLLDTLPVFIGWLWPLWDSSRRTFADMLTHTEVRCVERDERLPQIRRWIAIMLLVAAGVSLSGVGISYATVYSRQRATDHARSVIAVEGPRLVSRMLTYDPSTLREDFDRALALTTDAYRPKLAAEQDKVAKGHPVVNEYWVTAGAIQSATPDRITMLLFMQGRRGTGQEVRYITATVRANFVRGRDDHWLVDDLTVLAKPKPPPAPPEEKPPPAPPGEQK
ncbi:hypothetical protein BST27_03680 [Mycobacterium intermedium]|uniref:RDD domain-containing protein n=1 Tax=Mycobacterium intermedium TaxID=28445 RepID=A0A1E3SK60_MYCIE|nr:RDD family protein [Mycobacterium intermedium]MCV6962813.1 RDD family protein [Mycobacterium intermedium]ODR02544.1 hypothetical protein BHQ20_03220 [Mycobacterium intermedium]OPE50631.1 hypothetical protein BV508_09685 [Mycobacterium intermedium]ORB09911.1 hypothetical protein BST27_03680 [Mycobacterium intermedium]